jgi:hypothetical protein
MVTEPMPNDKAGRDEVVRERVIAVGLRCRGTPADCRAIAFLRTPLAWYTPEEAHRLLKCQPGALYIVVGGARRELLPACCGGAAYGRTAPQDSPDDALLSLAPGNRQRPT